MKLRQSFPALFVMLSLLVNAVALPLAPVAAAVLPVVDDFETGLPAGVDANGVAIGFNTFQDPNSSVSIATTAAPPAAVPGAGNPNNVLQINLSVASFAGVTHSFENAAQASRCPATDQRGVARPQGPQCDIGSFERTP